jgi:geranylgeranyl diphosphate synthase type II
VGLQKAKDMQKEMVDQAVTALKIFDEKAEPLRHIAMYIIERKK